MAASFATINGGKPRARVWPCKNLEDVAAKLLEDARIGIAPLEKSTRYVRFDQKDAAGNYLFYRERKIWRRATATLTSKS